MLDQALPADAPGSDDHVHDTLGDATLERDPLEAQGRQRRELGGLEHDRVAGGQGRGELPGGDREREVPGRDQADHAQRLAHRPGLSARDRDRVAQQPLGRARVVAEGLHDHRHLPAGVPDRLAGVARLEHGELLELVVKRGGQAAEQAGSHAGCQCAPPGIGVAGAGHGRVDLGRPGAREALEHRLGRGLED